MVIGLQSGLLACGSHALHPGGRIREHRAHEGRLGRLEHSGIEVISRGVDGRRRTGWRPGSIVGGSCGHLWVLSAPFTNAGLESDSAAALCLLTVAVTPANIFMYTHGAKLPMDSEPLPLQFHAVRWVMQVVLLGFLYLIGEETFQILLSYTTTTRNM